MGCGKKQVFVFGTPIWEVRHFSQSKLKETKGKVLFFTLSFLIGGTDVEKSKQTFFSKLPTQICFFKKSETGEREKTT